MRKRNPWLMVIIALCVLGLAQLACDDEDPPDPPKPDDVVQLPAAVRGGGWVQSGEGKATFGFQLTCDEGTGDIQGQFQYNDHAQRLAFHGVVQDNAPGCMVTVSEANYVGEYTPQPRTAEDAGTFHVQFDADSCLTVILVGGIYDGYTHSGCLEGGSIRVWGLSP